VPFALQPHLPAEVLAPASIVSGPNSPIQHLDEKEDRQLHPESLDPQTRANWALSQILAQSAPFPKRSVRNRRVWKRYCFTVAGLRPRCSARYCAKPACGWPRGLISGGMTRGSIALPSRSCLSKDSKVGRSADCLLYRLDRLRRNSSIRSSLKFQYFFFKLIVSIKYSIIVLI